MHSEQLLDHFRNPRNAGDVESADFTVEVENPVCGDQLRLTVKVSDVVEAVGFRARGCTAAIACGSALTELLQGKTRGDLAGVTAGEVEAAVGGLIAESKHAGVLCAEAVRRFEKAWKK
jgi:nitrogen fixation NifU-like protein